MTKPDPSQIRSNPRLIRAYARLVELPELMKEIQDSWQLEIKVFDGKSDELIMHYDTRSFSRYPITISELHGQSS